MWDHTAVVADSMPVVALVVGKRLQEQTNALLQEARRRLRPGQGMCQRYSSMPIRALRRLSSLAVIPQPLGTAPQAVRLVSSGAGHKAGRMGRCRKSTQTAAWSALNKVLRSPSVQAGNGTTGTCMTRTGGAPV